MDANSRRELINEAPDVATGARTVDGRLYQSVARHLIAAIADGTYPVGERMPAERELAQAFNVSRPTVREAIIALEVRGLVEVRVGSGVYVKERAAAGETESAGIGAFELTEARLLIEGEAAALAATNMSNADLDQLDKIVAQIASSNQEGGDGEVPDRDFHMMIARGTGNEAIVRAVEMLWNLRSASPECALLFSRARGGGSQPVVSEHAEIVAALRLHDPGTARAAMRAHLGAVIEHLLSATEAEAIERARAAVATTRSRFSRATPLGS